MTPWRHSSTHFWTSHEMRWLDSFRSRPVYRLVKPIYIYILIDKFLIVNQDKFLTSSSVHSINTRNKHHLHGPIANMSRFPKAASYSGIRIFNNLPQSITSLRNAKPQFKVALNIFLCAHSFYLVDELFACTDDMYCWLIWLCKFSHYNNFICFVCFCMFLTCSTSYCLVTASWIYGMYVCVCVCVCVCVYVCMYVCVCMYVRT